jgi:hypothetical protein
MRLPWRLRTLLVCAMLEYAALIGSPMRPEEIQELMRLMNQPKLVHVISEREPEPEPRNRNRNRNREP